MWYKINISEHGAYQTETGELVELEECYRVRSPDGRQNEQLGYTQYETQTEAIAAFGLKEIGVDET